jgi:hypothetical protein
MDLREQVNAARRQGYTDDEIANYIGQRDPRFNEALKEGYSASEVLNFVAPPATTGETMQRMAGVAGRAALPYVSTAAAASPLGPIGVVSALLAQGLSDLAISAYNNFYPDQKIPTTSEGIRMLYDKIGMGGVKPETRGERMVEAGTEALAATAPMVRAGQLLSASRTAPTGARAVGEEVSRAPIGQVIAAPAAGVSSQYVAEVTQNPYLALATGLSIGGAAGVRPRTKGAAPTKDEFQEQIDQKYETLNQSGIQVDDAAFRAGMFDVVKDLRKEGYSPTDTENFGRITSLVDDLTTNQQPKDIVELQAIRKQITASASPSEPTQYRMMKIIRDRFDDWVLNLPKNKFVAGDEQALKLWPQARDLFSKQKKAEIFEDILENAPVSKGQFSQSGMENYLYNELKKLSRNKQKLAPFTETERKAIKAAAEGSGLQNALKFVGRFAPTGVIPGFGTAGLAYLDPATAATLAAGSMASRAAAEQMRIGDVERLISMMRTGQQQPTITQYMPATTMRGLLSTETE